MAWYSNGLRAFDVTGELLGELDRQDRSEEDQGERRLDEEGACVALEGQAERGVPLLQGDEHRDGDKAEQCRSDARGN